MYLPFPTGKVCLSFGGTFFSLKGFSFLIYCFECMDTFHSFLSGYRHFSFYYQFILINHILFRNPYLSYLNIRKKLLIFLSFKTTLTSIATMLTKTTGGKGSSSTTMASFFSGNFSIPLLILSSIIFLKIQQ